jgi:hypothetical protein
MKLTIFVFCFFCGTVALGQTASVIPNQPNIVEIPDHPLQASQHALATEQSLLASSSYTYAQGERPLWEFGTVSQPVPLGDIARACRKEHELAKKAAFVFEKYVAQK